MNWENKARLILLNKSDLAEDKWNDAWSEYFREKGFSVVKVNSKKGGGIKSINGVIQEACKEKIERDRKRGILNRPVRAMVVGIPNVGKSSLINRLIGKASTKTGDKPGVTRGKQWLRIKGDAELLDTPGILPPKFEDQTVAVKLAYTGAIKDEIMNTELLAYSLCDYLRDNYPNELCTRYKLDTVEGLKGYEVLEKIGKKRGFVISGGEIDMERAANMVLDELRGAKIGHITLETPSQLNEQE